MAEQGKFRIQCLYDAQGHVLQDVRFLFHALRDDGIYPKIVDGLRYVVGMCRFVKFGVEGDAYQKTVADQFFEVVTAW